MDWLISDTHFNHINILEFERTEFSSIKEHDEFIMNQIERVVKKDDTLYHLGDVGSPTQEIIERFSKLKCKKILIRGNHDNSVSKIKNMFDEIHNEPIFYRKRILLSHEPLPVTDETINVHGHLHGSIINKENYMNISFNVIGNRLVSIQEVFNKLSKLKKISQKFMFEWYANDYKFLIPNKDVSFNIDGSINLENSQLNIISKKAMSLLENISNSWNENKTIPQNAKRYISKNNITIKEILLNIKDEYNKIDIEIVENENKIHVFVKNKSFDFVI